MTWKTCAEHVCCPCLYNACSETDLRSMCEDAKARRRGGGASSSDDRGDGSAHDDGGGSGTGRSTRPRRNAATVARSAIKRKFEASHGAPGHRRDGGGGDGSNTSEEQQDWVIGTRTAKLEKTNTEQRTVIRELHEKLEAAVLRGEKQAVKIAAQRIEIRELEAVEKRLIKTAGRMTDEIGAAQNEVKARRSAVTAARGEVYALKVRAAEAERERDGLREWKERATEAEERAAGRVESARGELERWKFRLAQATHERGRLREDSAVSAREKASAEEKVGRLRSGMVKLQSQIRQLQAENKELCGKDVIDLTADQDGLEMRKLCGEAKERSSAIKFMHDTALSCTTKLVAIKTEKEETKKEVENAREELESAQETLSYLILSENNKMTQIDSLKMLLRQKGAMEHEIQSAMVIKS